MNEVRRAMSLCAFRGKVEGSTHLYALAMHFLATVCLTEKQMHKKKAESYGFQSAVFYL